MDTKIKKLEKELEELKKQRTIDGLKSRIPYMQLAEIGTINNVSDKAKLEYEKLFDEFATEKINLMRQDLQSNWSRKKFVFKIGFE